MRFFPIAGTLVAVSLLLLALTVFTLPLAAYSQVFGDGFIPLAGSRIFRGVALVKAGTPDPAVLRWRWCPRAGLFSFCVKATGGSALWKGVAAPRIGAIEVRELEVRDWDLAVPAVAGDMFQVRLRGAVHGAQVPWKGACISQLLTSAHEGRFFVAFPAQGQTSGGEVELEIKGSGEGVVKVSGNDITGSFRVGDSGVEGDLRIHSRYLPFGQAGDGAMVAIKFSRALPCPES